MHMTLPPFAELQISHTQGTDSKKGEWSQTQKKKTHILETPYCEKKSFKTPDTLL